MHRLLVPVSAAALLVAAGSLAAQQPKPPDCSAPEYRQFDFWVGDWTVASPAGKPQGTSHVELILSRCVVFENWTGAGGGAGKSFNIYDRHTHQWHQSWVSSNGTLLLLNGTFHDGAMVLSGDSMDPQGHTVKNRVTWKNIDGNPDLVSQVWEQSKDGKTWSVVFNGRYARRKMP